MTTKQSGIKSGLTGERNDISFSIEDLPYSLAISKEGRMQFIQKSSRGKHADATAGLAMQYLNLYYQKEILKQLNRLNRRKEKI